MTWQDLMNVVTNTHKIGISTKDGPVLSLQDASTGQLLTRKMLQVMPNKNFDQIFILFYFEVL